MFIIVELNTCLANIERKLNSNTNLSEEELSLLEKEKEEILQELSRLIDFMID